MGRQEKRNSNVRFEEVSQVTKEARYESKAAGPVRYVATAQRQP
jgi:hypothetical protein